MLASTIVAAVEAGKLQVPVNVYVSTTPLTVALDVQEPTKLDVVILCVPCGSEKPLGNVTVTKSPDANAPDAELVKWAVHVVNAWRAEVLLAVKLTAVTGMSALITTGELGLEGVKSPEVLTVNPPAGRDPGGRLGIPGR